MTTRWIIPLSAVLSLATSSGCKEVDCGAGTIERNGSCQPATETIGNAMCGPFTELQGDKCVPMFPPTECDPGTTSADVDPTTGVTTCLGTGGGGCSSAFACPAPAAGKQTICGQLYNLEDDTVFAAAGASGAKCPATPTTDGPCSLGITAYDAIAFGTNPGTAVPLAVGSTYIDDCGRYRVTDITVPSGPFIGLGIDDADMAKRGPMGTTNTVGVATPKSVSMATKDFEGYIAKSSTTSLWTSSGGPAITTGYYVNIFRAHTKCSPGTCTAAQLRQNQAGVTTSRAGGPNTANDFYFQAAQTSRQTVDAAATVTGMNGTALITNAAVSEGPTYAGTGAIPAECAWESHAGATLPNIVFIQIFRPQNAVANVRALNRIVVAVLALASTTAVADPTSGVDGALFRSSYDTGGIFAVEGARLMTKRDFSLKVLLGYSQSPLDLAVPGIGSAMGDTNKDRILDYVVTLDAAFGMSLTDKIAIGFDIGGYRTATGVGYGARGRYANGAVATPSTGLIALRPLSNIDPSANPNDSNAYLGDGLAGPLDVRAGLKFGLFSNQHLAITAIGSAFLPFGEDEMLLGDRGIVFEPKIAVDYRKDRIHATRFIGNLSGRFRKRSILEGYDTMDSMATPDTSKVYLDVGSEVVVGAGGVYELTPRTVAALEAQAFIPLPSSITYGDCHRYNGARCSSITDADYFHDAKAGDLTVLVTLGMMLRVSADVTANIMIGTGQLGARGDDFRFTTGLMWAPQPAGAAAPGRNDKDGDGIPDSVDGCPDDPEDKDGFQDEDGCPDVDNDGDGIPDADDQCPNEPEDKDGFKDTDGCREDDNDGDGIPDAVDKCPDQAEDKDGFEDEDGCLDQDNDGDGFADAVDKCPNDAETVNGVDDDDGCPDVRGTTGPEERADRIDLKGGQITFTKGTTQLSAATKALLGQVADIIKKRKLSIRIEVHVPLGTKATGAAAVTAQKKKDKATAQTRAKAIFDYLATQGVAANQLQAVGIGSDRPLGSAAPTDAVNERTDFIKAQQGGTP